MGYDKKTWTDRQSQYPNRRKLIASSLENVYEIERAEGEVTEPGNRFNAENMNDFERRVSTAFTNLNDSEITVQDKKNYFTASKLDGVLNELFSSADSGKKTIASAIGTTPDGTATSSMSFAQMADLIKKYKNTTTAGTKAIVDAIGATPGGTATTSMSLDQLSNLIKNNMMSYTATTLKGIGGTAINATVAKGSSRTIHIILPVHALPMSVVISGVEIEWGSDSSLDVPIWGKRGSGGHVFCDAGHIEAFIGTSSGKYVLALYISAYEKLTFKILASSLIQIHWKGY